MLFTNPWLQHKTKQTLQLIMVLATVFLSSPTMAQVDPIKEAMDEALATPPLTDVELYYDLGGAMPIPIGGTTRVKIKFDPTQALGMNLGCDGFGVFTSMEGILEDTKNSIFSAYQGIVNFVGQGILSLAVFSVIQSGAPDLYNSLMEILEKAKLDFDFQLKQCADFEQAILNEPAKGIQNIDEWGTPLRNVFKDQAAVKIFQASKESGGNDGPSIHNVIEDAKLKAEEEGVDAPCKKGTKTLTPGSTLNISAEILTCGYDKLANEFDEDHKPAFDITTVFPTAEEFVVFGEEWLGQWAVVTASDLSREVLGTDGFGPRKFLTDISYDRNTAITDAVKERAEQIQNGDNSNESINAILQKIAGECRMSPPTVEILDYFAIAPGDDIVDFSARLAAQQGATFTYQRGLMLWNAIRKSLTDPTVRDNEFYKTFAIGYMKRIYDDLDAMRQEDSSISNCNKLTKTYDVFSNFVKNKRNAAANIETFTPDNRICFGSDGNVEACPSNELPEPININ